jgi:hypothetical protein
VARAIAARFEASLIGVSAFAVEPNFVAEGVIIEETTPGDIKRMKTALAEKEQWFRDIVGLPKEKVERVHTAESDARHLIRLAKDNDRHGSLWPQSAR